MRPQLRLVTSTQVWNSRRASTGSPQPVGRSLPLRWTDDDSRIAPELVTRPLKLFGSVSPPPARLIVRWDRVCWLAALAITASVADARSDVVWFAGLLTAIALVSLACVLTWERERERRR